VYIITTTPTTRRKANVFMTKPYACFMDGEVGKVGTATVLFRSGEGKRAEKPTFVSVMHTLEQSSYPIGLDFERCTLDTKRTTLIQLCSADLVFLYRPGTATKLPFALAAFLSNARVVKVVIDPAADEISIRSDFGVTCQGIVNAQTYAAPFGLHKASAADLALFFLGYDMADKKLEQKQAHFNTQPMDVPFSLQAIRYAFLDAVVAYEVGIAGAEAVKEQGQGRWQRQVSLGFSTRTTS
jgi:ribonuclease D